MAHFGRIRSRPTQTLWGSIAAGGGNQQPPFRDSHGRLVNKDSDRFVTDYSRPGEYLKKWNVAQDPIRTEHTRSKLEAPPNVREVEQQRRYQAARTQALRLPA